MVIRKRRKVRKLRGSRTHGWGRVGQHRKSGGRGGFGHAGMHKHKWSYTVKYAKNHFGKKGFTRPKSTLSIKNVINVGDIESLLPNVETKFVDNKMFIDLESLGYDKLLGSGQITRPVIIKVREATEKAQEKVIKSGGKVLTMK
jgi:large subunit ribosomal protein L15